ncbi:hypothetical protein DL95DRAFT_387988, partial [Leptodontidium sp. 2 PMI_412]
MLCHHLNAVVLCTCSRCHRDHQQHVPLISHKAIRSSSSTTLLYLSPKEFHQSIALPKSQEFPVSPQPPPSLLPLLLPLPLPTLLLLLLLTTLLSTTLHHHRRNHTILLPLLL